MIMASKIAFISYRGDYHKLAESAAQSLRAAGYCDDYLLVPPGEICEAGELLLPYDYIELMEHILEGMFRQCNLFFYLNTEDYWQSYFTNAEVTQWRRRNDRPVAYSIGQDHTGRFVLSNAIHWLPMDTNERKLWASLSVGIAPSYQHHRNPGFQGGKFNRNCFLLPCRSCGEHFLASQKVIYSVLKGSFGLQCPHCGSQDFHFVERNYMGNFKRRPIVLSQSQKHPIRVLDNQEMLQMLVQNTPPDNIPVITFPDENLDSDMTKVVKGVLTVAGGIALLLLASSFFGNREK
jgi:hypothetical protein